MDTLTHISLFSGYGGADLGLKLWGMLSGTDIRTVCYVELEKYCQQIIQARIADGALDDAPIWDDVRTFDGRPWRGKVDIISGGFPCQDISCAGAGAGLDGARSGLFYEIIRLADEIRPRFILLENVSALYVRGLDRVLGALAEAGYDARWTSVRASDVGSPHRRERWFCLAHDNTRRSGASRTKDIQRPPTHEKTGGRSKHELGDANHTRLERHRQHGECVGERAVGPTNRQELADTKQRGQQGQGQDDRPLYSAQNCEGQANGSNDDYQTRLGLWPLGFGSNQHEWEPPRLVANTTKQRHSGAKRKSRAGTQGKPNGHITKLPGVQGENHWSLKSKLGRNANGRSNRVDRLKALGNGIVPQQLAMALIELFDGILGKEQT